MSAWPKNPINHFANWLREAEEHAGIDEANAMNLATSTPDGLPSSRMVLLKEHGPDGFIFYTNLGSRKAQQLELNPYAALCFYWEVLAKQIRIEGNIEAVDGNQADKYFASRPLRSKLGAWASRQSQPLESSGTLVKEIAIQSARFSIEKLTRPPFWSGFCLKPNRIEFWTRGQYRLHERLCYTVDEKGKWTAQLLYP